jgi:hypothetical protein
MPFGELGLPQPISLGLVWPEPPIEPIPEWLIPYGKLGIPFELQIGKVKLTLFSMELGTYFAPEPTGFFFNAGLGFRYFQIWANMSSYSIDELTITNAKIDFLTFYLTLGLGYCWRLTPAMLLKIGLEGQLALWGKADLILENTNTGQNSSNYAQFATTTNQNSMDRIARLFLPKITLLQLTWDVF